MKHVRSKDLLDKCFSSFRVLALQVMMSNSMNRISFIDWSWWLKNFMERMFTMRLGDTEMLLEDPGISGKTMTVIVGNAMEGGVTHDVSNVITVTNTGNTVRNPLVFRA